MLALIHIPGGTFMMGSPEGEGFDDERPQHLVEVAPFAIAAHPVTQDLYRAVTGKSPSHFGEKGRGNCPVESVSWFDAIAFCNLLSDLEGKPRMYDAQGSRTGAVGGYRLPTEEEWEYSCRAGTTGPYYWGDDASDATLSAHVHWAKNCDRPQPVGLKPPNPWGIYGMLGNVWEWTETEYETYVEKLARRDRMLREGVPA